MNSVLITGASRGLGYELSKVFHQNNYEVFVVVRDKDKAKELKNQFTKRFHVIIADISVDTSIEIIKTILSQNIHSLDLLINNAGIPGREHEIEKVATQEINELFNVHCLGVIRAIQGCLDFLKNSKNPRIINISSRLGSLSKMSGKEFEGRKISYSYRIAKASQNMLSICLNQELKNKGICVNSVHPGKLKTASGSSDADMEASDAAKRIYTWAENLDINKSGNFIEPYVKEWTW